MATRSTVTPPTPPLAALPKSVADQTVAPVPVHTTSTSTPGREAAGQRTINAGGATPLALTTSHGDASAPVEVHAVERLPSRHALHPAAGAARDDARHPRLAFSTLPGAMPLPDSTGASSYAANSHRATPTEALGELTRTAHCGTASVMAAAEVTTGGSVIPHTTAPAG